MAPKADSKPVERYQKDEPKPVAPLPGPASRRPIPQDKVDVPRRAPGWGRAKFPIKRHGVDG